ncbi:MAG: hypothetical protein WB819_18605, partial [Terriglobia bacterium]
GAGAAADTGADKDPDAASAFSALPSPAAVMAAAVDNFRKSLRFFFINLSFVLEVAARWSGIACMANPPAREVSGFRCL